MLLLRVDRGRWRGRPGHRLRVTVQVTDSTVICECPLVTVTAARHVARRGSCDGKLRVSGPAARATAAQVSLLCRSGRRRAAGRFTAAARPVQCTGTRCGPRNLPVQIKFKFNVT